MRKKGNMSFDRSIKTLKKNLRREPYLAVSSILIMTLTFLTLNIFLFFVIGSGIVLKFLEDKAQISIFFLDTTTTDQILKTKSDIEKDARISKVNFISKEDALVIFKELNKDEPALLESVQSNPLPASLEVKAKNISDLQKLSEEFGKLEGVEDVKFYKDVVDTFRKWSIGIKVAGLTLLFVLSLVSVLMVLITVGITIHSKGVEVEILKLVGASDKYVKTPLILQGMFYGVSAAFLSTIIIYILISAFSPVVSSLFRGVEVGSGTLRVLFSSPYKYLSLLGILFIELIFGMLLGYIGSAAAIKKYLKY